MAYRSDRNTTLCLFVMLLLAVVSAFAIVAVISAEPGDADNAQVNVDGITYEISDKGYAIVVDANDATSINIKGSVEKDGKSYAVIEIASKALSKCVSMTSISLPDSMKSIDSLAFMGCRSLLEIKIPVSTAYISEEAFDGCNALRSISVADNNTKFSSKDGVLFELDSKTPRTLVKYPAAKTDEKYDIPDTVNKVGAMAFALNHNLKQVTTTSASVIDDRAFIGCINLTNIRLSYSTASIGNMAFSACKSLETIEIPANVNSIHLAAFSGCDSLRAITVNENNKDFCSDGGVLFDKEKTLLIKYPANKTDVTEYAVPNTVKTIGPSAFMNNKAINTISLPSTVTKVNTSSFYGCISLKILKVDANNEKYCDIDGVLFNKDVTEIVKFPAAKVSNEYSIPNSVTKIDTCAFTCCHGIGTLTITKNVQYVGELVFFGSSIKTITVDSENGYYCSDGGVLYDKEKSKLCYYPSGKTDETFKVPDSVIRFGNSNDVAASCGLSNNVHLKSIVVNNEHYKSVDGIVYSKDGSTLLICPAGKTAVKVASSTKEIGYGAFINSSMTNLTIPDNVKVDTGAIVNCTFLKTITVEGNGVSFEYLSIDFSDATSTYKITVEAPNGYTIPAISYTANIVIDYHYNSTPSGSDSTWIIILVLVIVLLAIVAAAYYMYRKRA